MSIFNNRRPRKSLNHLPPLKIYDRSRTTSSNKPLILLLVCVLFILCLYFFFRSDIFFIKQINLKRESSSPVVFVQDQKIQEDLEPYKATSLITLKTAEIQKRLLNQYIELSTVVVKKKWTQTLLVTFCERKPIAVLKAKNGNFVVDETGLVFANFKDNISAPLFDDMQKEWQLGQIIDSAQLSFALQLVNKFNQLELIPTDFLLINDRDLLIKTKEQTDCYFTSQKDMLVQLETAKIVLKDAKINGKKITKIDVRFSRPVITQQ